MQDTDAERELPILSVNNIKQILNRENYNCFYCKNNLQINTWSLDRIDNTKPHDYNNCVACCQDCNKKRKHSSFLGFCKEKVIRRFTEENENKLIFLVTKGELFHLFKKNIVGGPSIVFHRYHEKDVTFINKITYDLKNNKFGYKDTEKHCVKRVVGYDCNSLYPWGMMQDMLCGQLSYTVSDNWDEMKQAILDNSFFGACEVDIELPKKLWSKFAEFPPIFINTKIDSKKCGDYVDSLIKALQEQEDNIAREQGLSLSKVKRYKHTNERKLISCFSAEKILLITPLLKWYLEHGLIVTKLYGYVEAERHAPLKSYIEWGAAERRKGDVVVDGKKPYAAKADNAKNGMNAYYGGTIMNKSNQLSTVFCSEEDFNTYKNEARFCTGEEHEKDGDYVFEASMKKRIIRQNIPVHVGYAILQYAKLCMLKFYYDFLAKYLDMNQLQLIQMDTDSLYFAISADHIDNIVKEDKKEEYWIDKHNWIPRTKSCPCCKDNPKIEELEAYENRTPGLFKVEKEGTGMIALTSKSYFMKLDNGKFKRTGKGAQQTRNNASMQWEHYKRCLFMKEIIKGENSGFRLIDGAMKTYKMEKIILTPIYLKRMLFDDGIHTAPLIPDLVENTENSENDRRCSDRGYLYLKYFKLLNV